MRCLACQHESPPSARFCANCGAQLRRACPRCGTPASGDGRFCSQCGAPLPPGPPAPPDSSRPSPPSARLGALLGLNPPAAVAPEGENRVVTILFTDMVGSVRALSGMDAEEAGAYIDPLLDIMRDTLRDFGAWADGFLGDGYRAYFGWPQAFEDGPVRAIRAALRIREEARRQGYRVTAGINTGEVRIPPAGPDGQVELRIVSDVINRAARLQAAAEAGQVLVGSSTFRQARHAFRFSPVTVRLKGVEEPVAAYLVEEPLLHPQRARGIEGLQADLVGREREMGRLRSALDAVLSGEGRFVSIVGEAGLGKSRLVSELRQVVERMDAPPGEGVLWLEGRCFESTQGISYSLFLDLLAGFVADEGRRAGDDGLTSALRSLADAGHLAPDRAEEVRALLANLLPATAVHDLPEGLQDAPPDQVKHQTFLALRDVVAGLARRQPTVFVLEDLHWADSLSIELTAFLMECLPSERLLILSTYRPEREHRCSRLAHLAQRRCPEAHGEITLTELPPAQSRTLVELLLHVEDLPPPAKEAVLDRARGNPFFLEEVLRLLIDEGAVYQEDGRWRARGSLDLQRVPETVLTVIQSRVDRLAPDVKRALQGAAVIGRVFRPRLLQQVLALPVPLEPMLWEMEDRGLICLERSVPEEEYSFRHVLTRDAVYHSILRRHRAPLHQSVARAMESLYEDRLPGLYEEIARHYSLGGDVRKAIDYLLKAGRKTMAMYANQEALDHLRTALSRIEGLPEGSERDLLEAETRELLGDVCFTTGAHAEAETHLRKATALRQALGDNQATAALAGKLADSLHWQERYDEAIEVAEAGLLRLQESEPTAESVRLMEILMRSWWTKGEWDAAGSYVRLLSEALPQVPYFEGVYPIYYGIAYTEMARANLKAAEQWLSRMERVCAEHGNEKGLARCYHGKGDLWRVWGDRPRAIECLRESLRYSERTGDAHSLLEGSFEMAYLLILTGGDAEEVDRYTEAGLRIAQGMSDGHSVATGAAYCEMLADACVAVGEVERGLDFYHRALAFGLPLAPARFLSKLEMAHARRGSPEDFPQVCDRVRERFAAEGRLPMVQWQLRPTHPRPELCRPVVAEEFHNGSLSTGWEWSGSGTQSRVLPVPQEGYLEIEARPGERLEGSRTTAPVLLRRVEGDFAAEAVLVSVGQDGFCLGGLVLWASPRDYVVLGQGSPLPHDLRLAARRGDGMEIVGRGWLPDGCLWLRLERVRHTVTALCSSNGSTWLNCGETRFPLPDPLGVGLYATCPPFTLKAGIRAREFRLFARSEP